MDPSPSALSPTPCARCTTPLELGDLRCAVCALPVPAGAGAGATLAADERAKILRCGECGAAVAFSAAVAAPRCVFCRATTAIEQPVDPLEVAGLHVPFAVDHATATSALRGWLGAKRMFAPSDLAREAVIGELAPLGWAAWIVNAHVRVTWTADSDEGAHRSRWAPHAGEMTFAVANLAVPASRGLSLDECHALLPSYDLATAEAIGELEHVVEQFDAQRSVARKLVHEHIEALAAARVTDSCVPGSRSRNIHVSVLCEQLTTARVALPAWVMAYRYRDKPFRAVIHGQRPELVIGSPPTDWAKVIAACALGLVVLAAIVIAIAYFRR